MEKIGIYGGTFNPPHIGHFRAAYYAREALGLDRVLMLPDKEAPHKVVPGDSPAPEHRLEMVRLGLDGMGVEASGLSLEREGPSYAWQTVRQVRCLYPDADLYFLMGSDMLESFPDWLYPERILKDAALAVFCRGDKGEADRLEEAKTRVEALGGRVVLLNNPITEISSTQLRRMLIFRCAGDFLPERVEEYIQVRNLYGTGQNFRHLKEAELEKVVVSLLKPGRVAHVLGCRDTAVALARHYGVNETDAARSALLHDITKALDGPLQLTLCRSYGTMLDDFSQKNPKTLHALTGSLVAERIFGENEAVVSAIRCHTTGKADMNTLEKILYVADYMEPNRDFPGVERLRELAWTDITQALKLGLEMTLAMLREQKREISPESREALSYLENCGQ